jgi:hypothetical protein
LGIQYSSIVYTYTQASKTRPLIIRNFSSTPNLARKEPFFCSPFPGFSWFFLVFPGFSPFFLFFFTANLEIILKNHNSWISFFTRHLNGSLTTYSTKQQNTMVFSASIISKLGGRFVLSNVLMFDCILTFSSSSYYFQLFKKIQIKMIYFSSFHSRC